MTTAAEIVSDATALILVDEANTGLEPNEFAIAVRFLNDMCAELYDDDIDFGYRPVSSPSDLLSSPTSVNSALKYMLAKRLNAIFGLPMPQEVFIEARRLEASLNNRYQRSISQIFPDTLPTGSGNWRDTFQDDNFYQLPQPEAFLRLTAPLTPSIPAAASPVALSGFAVDRQINVRSNGSSITYVNTGAYYAMFDAVFSLSAGNDDLLTFAFAKNGVPLQQSAIQIRDGAPSQVKLRWAENLRKDDVVTVLVANEDNDNDPTITTGTFRVT